VIVCEPVRAVSSSVPELDTNTTVGVIVESETGTPLSNVQVT